MDARRALGPDDSGRALGAHAAVVGRAGPHAARRSLVTGGAGFIGSNLVDALVEAGHEVVAVDDLSRGRRENLAAAVTAGARLVEGDIRDAEAMAELCRELRPDAIFHLAARANVRHSIENPRLDADVNVQGTLSMLEAARHAGVERFVNTSTGGAIYGDAQSLPTDEATEPRPKAPYGQSKLAAEGYCALYERLHGLSTITLRYGNVYGPRQDPLGEAGVIAIFCGKAQYGGEPAIYGDGLQTRDYVYVGDVVRANLAAAESDVHGAFNVGRGEQTSVLDLVEIVASLAGRSFQPEFRPERKGEVKRSALDASRARTELGWIAETPVREGLEKTLAALATEAPRPA